MKNILLFWSGGKDSSLTLSRLKKIPDYKIMGLVTILDPNKNSVRFHGIPEVLIVEQAKLLNLPLIRIYIEPNISNEEYVAIIKKRLTPFKKKGLNEIAFGDIHLEDVKEFKEKMCKEIGVNSVFPLWNESNELLIEEFFSTNQHAIITAIDNSKLELSMLAKEFTREWIAKLPKNIDSFGENGEFHTFATYSPQFKTRIQYSKAIAIEDGPYTITTLKEP